MANDKENEMLSAIMYPSAPSLLQQSGKARGMNAVDPVCIRRPHRDWIIHYFFSGMQPVRVVHTGSIQYDTCIVVRGLLKINMTQPVKTSNVSNELKNDH